MSFVDHERPQGQKYLGSCVVDGEDLENATKNAWRIGCNPGGEILSVEVPEYLRIDKWMNRLLTEQEVREMDKELIEIKNKRN